MGSFGCSDCLKQLSLTAAERTYLGLDDGVIEVFVDSESDGWIQDDNGRDRYVA